MTLARKLTIRNILIASVAMLLLAMAILPVINYYNKQQSKDDLYKMLAIYEAQITSADYTEDEEERQEIFGVIAALQDETKDTLRVTILSGDGEIIYAESTTSTEPQSDRPEIIDAVSSGVGYAERYSQSFNNRKMLYYAKQVSYGEDKVIVRVAVNYNSLNDYLIPVILLFIGILIIVITIYGLFSQLTSRQYNRALNSIAGQLKEVNSGLYIVKKPMTGYADVDELIAGINTVSQDISDKINKLNNEKNTLNTVLSNMQQGVIALDQESTVLLINSAAEDIFKSKGLLGKNILYLTQEDSVINAVKEALETDSSSYFELDLEDRIYGANVSIYHDFTEAKRCLIILTDITITRNLEKMRMEFFSNASHELKTPLTAISGFSELIEGEKNPDNIVKFNRLIRENIDRMIRLLEDMLYLTKIDSRTEEESERLDLKALVEECRETLATEIKDKEVKVEISGSAEIFASKEKMTQILINLLTNAVRYNKQGGSVAVNLENYPKKVIITVKDTGIGIDGVHIGRIFERFYRVDKSRSKKMGGTGLGLAIVKNIAAMYGGEVSVKSVKGEGSEFKVMLIRR